MGTLYEESWLSFYGKWTLLIDILQNALIPLWNISIIEWSSNAVINQSQPIPRHFSEAIHIQRHDGTLNIVWSLVYVDVMCVTYCPLIFKVEAYTFYIHREDINCDQ